MFTDIGRFTISKRQKELFRSGELWKRWVEQYPFLFDKIDRRYFENQSKYGYGFVEALAAIFLYDATLAICLF
jgi:Ni,Fe-hydrogenase III large subunit